MLFIYPIVNDDDTQLIRNERTVMEQHRLTYNKLQYIKFTWSGQTQAKAFWIQCIS